MGSIDRIVDKYRPSAIVNVAAYTGVDKAESEIDLAFRVNRDGAGRLAHLAERLHAPFIHISTDYVFDGTKLTSYREDDRTAPLSIYGCSKREGEIAVLAANPDAVVIRTSWVYSAYGHNFVKTMLRLGETRDCIRVVDDQHGTPTSARDLAHAIIKILPQLAVKSSRNFSGIYHLTAAGTTTWYGFAAAIFSGWAKRGRRTPSIEPIMTADYPTPARRPANSQLDCNKAAQAFGIELPHWQQGLETCLVELALGEMSAQSC
jgi:dTDP-4-dehydrorhamnose reductase